MSNFLLMVMHLFKRSLYFSSNFCCSSICLLRSQFAYKEEKQIRISGSQYTIPEDPNKIQTVARYKDTTLILQL